MEKPREITNISDLDGDLEDREKHNPGNPPKKIKDPDGIEREKGEAREKAHASTSPPPPTIVIFTNGGKMAEM